MTSTDNSPESSKELSALEREPIEDVIAWLLDGHRDADIRAAIEATWPGTDAKELQIAAVEHFAAAARFDMEVVHGWALEAYRDLYKRMVKIGDFAGAMRAVKELVALATNVRYEREETDEEGDELESGPGQPAAELVAPDPPPEPAKPAAKRRSPQKRPAQGRTRRSDSAR